MYLFCPYVSVEMSKYQERPSAHSALPYSEIAESCRAVSSQLVVVDPTMYHQSYAAQLPISI
jgi:hypothetical protein